MKLHWLLIAATVMPRAAAADVVLACLFDTIPQVVLTYPQDPATAATMQVASRPAAEMVVGQGTDRLETAMIDGYRFQFAPANLSMDVQKDGAPLVTEIGRCVTMGGPANETPLTLGEVVAAAPPDKGKWLVSEDTSLLDDSTTVVLSMNSNETIAGQFGAAGPAQIYLRCLENTTSVFLILNDMFLSDIQGFGTVDFRIDATQADEVRMQSSTDNKALGLWSGGSAIPFAKRLMGGEKVVFRATPYNESPVEFSFDLTGLPVAIDPLRKACKW
jgi:type VI secretion system protein VasI